MSVERTSRDSHSVQDSAEENLLGEVSEASPKTKVKTLVWSVFF